MTAPLVILDRDGVINHDSDEYIRRPEEWRPIPGSIEAIGDLSRAGFIVTVATNQSGLARGYFDEYALANIHARMLDLVEEQGGRIDGIFFCPHHPDDRCTCRKPATGMLERIESEFSVPVAGAWYVGDSEKDLDAALAMTCRPILVRTGKGESTLASLPPEKRKSILVFDDLAAAASHILGHVKQN